MVLMYSYDVLSSPGGRGMAKMVRATGFGRHADEYIASLEKNLVGVIQIETLNALQNIDNIAATEGVDVLFVGPNDLSLALGIFGDSIIRSTRRRLGMSLPRQKSMENLTGVLLQDVSEYEMYYQLGYRFLACGADSAFVRKGADELVKKLKERSGKWDYASIANGEVSQRVMRSNEPCDYYNLRYGF